MRLSKMAEVHNMNEAMTNQGAIKTELIPATVAESIGQAALDGFLHFKQYLQKHPEEARRFNERVEEVKKRRSRRQ